MTSIVSICKLALTNIGKDTINDLSEPTAEARACNLFYDQVRDTLLQSYPWRFAGGRKSLAEISNDRSEWSHAYTRPADCLKILWVEPEGGRRGVLYPHDAEDGKIYCNLSPAYLRYTKRLTDPTRYPPLFIEALSWHLAVRLAMPLTRDPKVRADAYQLAIRLQGEAASADANEVSETSDHETDFAPDAYAGA
jgi:hypothetical protein